MCAITLPTSTRRTPVHLSFSAQTSSFVALFSEGTIECWTWELPLIRQKGQPRGEVPTPALAWTVRLGAGGKASCKYACQIAMLGALGAEKVAVLFGTARGSELCLVSGKAGEERSWVDVAGGALRLIAGEDEFVLESQDGTLLSREFFRWCLVLIKLTHSLRSVRRGST